MLFRLSLIALLFCAFVVSPVFALPGQLSGAIEYRYAQHTAQERGEKVLDAQHFTQKYSVLWETAGTIQRGRAGVYDFSLGYEWNWIDSEVNTTKSEIDNPLDKILFRGDVLLAPRGLPFSLNLYSSDLNSTSYSYQELGELFTGDKYPTQRGIITSFQNGSHVITGMTLLAGEKNGRAFGIYRDALNSLPRLLIDFRQDDVRDVKSPDPRHYRDRNLAFVSLNKNKNWFHYRFFTHEDMIDPGEDYDISTYLIGTIDHRNRREWVDLTNWIQVSSDLSYSETSAAPSGSKIPQERYDLNLFARAQRSRWRGSAYNSFSRIREEASLSKYLSTPVFANGEFNRDTAWRFNFDSYFEQKIRTLNSPSQDTQSLYLSGRIDALRQAHYVVSPVLEMEHKEGDRGAGLSLRARVETYSNPLMRGRFGRLVELFGSYSISAFNGTAQDGADVKYLEQSLEGRADRVINAKLRVGGKQVFDFGNGRYNSSVSDRIRAKLTEIEFDKASGVIDGSTLRSFTSVYAEHQSFRRLNNRFELSFDYVDSPVGNGSQFLLSHDLNYYGNRFDLAWNSLVVIGGALPTAWARNLVTDSISDLNRRGGTVDNSAKSKLRLSYDPDRVHHNLLRGDIEWRSFKDGGSDRRYYAQQIYKYSLWKNSGLVRRIAEFGEEFEYDWYRNVGVTATSLAKFTLFSNYYPTRNTLLGVKLRYEVDNELGTNTALMFLTAGMSFSKFEMHFDYSYGERDEGVLLAERTEHKWELFVKKTF